jgi:hypothetical protein
MHARELVAAYASSGLEESAKDRELEERVERHVSHAVLTSRDPATTLKLEGAARESTRRLVMQRGAAVSSCLLSTLVY